MMKKCTALFLCLVLFVSCFQFSAAAEFDWDSYYDSYMQTKGNVLMNPGSNDTQRNFSWYSERGSKDCKVLLSENEDMSGAVTFSGKTVRVPQGDCVNKVTVSGLKADTTYYYQCVTSKSESAVASFDTIKGDDFTAMYVTDIHVTYDENDDDDILNLDDLRRESGKVNELLQAATSKTDLDLVISAGDQGSYGMRSEYVSLIASPLWSSIPFALCAGNHDRKGFDYRFFNNNPNQYKKGIGSYIAKDYWYVKGDVLFMVFDSNCFAAETHRKFAADAIAKNPDVKWRVGALHHDMYGIMSQKRVDYAEEYLRPIFGRIFDEYGFDLVLTGHTHHYTMSNAVVDDQTKDSIVGKDSITDAKGTIYLVSGSINHPRTWDDGDVVDKNVGYSYPSGDKVLYNLLDFSEDSITINSYELGADEPFHTFTINKTTQKGGHPDYTPYSNQRWDDFGMEFKAFFEELGIAIKVIFNIPIINAKQK